MNGTNPTRTASAGLLILRLFLGLGIAAHGWTKFFGPHGLRDFAGHLASMGVPRPEWAAALSAGTELVGGALLAAGLLTRLAALPLAFNMIVAVLLVHRGSYFLSNQPPGMEYALNLAAAFAALALLGPGRFSLDHLLCSRTEKYSKETP
jgi:putative oxidoreductase